MHGDVFRPPSSLVLLSAVVGTGAQLALLVLLVILMAIIGTLYVGYVLHTYFQSVSHFVVSHGIRVWLLSEYRSCNENFLLTLFRRGAIVTTFIVCYALTSFISGYVSGGMYSRSGGMLYPSLLQAARNISNNIPSSDSSSNFSYARLFR